jgi:stearoyl-CoA desaturase (Delta-9 desaturase)
MEDTPRHMYRQFRLSLPSTFFILIHFAAACAVFFDPTPMAMFLLVFMFVTRKFGITGGFHRYFAHRSYKTSRVFQFFLAFLGGMAGQKGALWWAAHHRHHHQHSDSDEDLHSADKEGFYWSHVGWVLSDEYDRYDPDSIKDFSKYPELVWLNTYFFVPPVVAGVGCWLLGGWSGLFWGFFVSSVVLYHTTFAINSLCHMFGRQRYATGEHSKNCWWLAILTLGEGWHNNHHYYQASCRQGFFWWEIDLTYYFICFLQKLGIVWDVKGPPERILRPEAMTALHPRPAAEPKLATPALAKSR